MKHKKIKSLRPIKKIDDAVNQGVESIKKLYKKNKLHINPEIKKLHPPIKKLSIIKDKYLNKHHLKNDSSNKNQYTQDIFDDYLVESPSLLSVVTEREEDYGVHMIRKNIAEERLGKPLKNKKYKTDKDGNYINPEKAKRAELKYSYDDKLKEGKNVAQHPNAWDYDMNTYYIKTKESTIRLLEYMKNKAKNGKTDEDIKNYKRVFRMFCNKYNIKPDSSLYIEYDPDDLYNPKGHKSDIRVREWKTSKKYDSKETKGVENLHVLPAGYRLVHRSPEDKLTELDPKRHSNRYFDETISGVGGQYHDTGRIYFTLVTDKDTRGSESWGGLGANHMYELTSKIRGFYIDSENRKSLGMDKYPISKLVGKAVYVKTDRPLKVKQLK